jgi:hypothetical protein
MKNILTILLLVFLTGCSGTGYNDWTEKEQTKYKYFLGLQAVDTLQTYKALKYVCTSDMPLNVCLEEGNPVYGNNPSPQTLVGVKLLSNLLIYAALRGDTDLMSRETSLNIMNTATTLVIINNQIQINKVF